MHPTQQLLLDFQETPLHAELHGVFPPRDQSTWLDLIRVLGDLEEALHDGTIEPPRGLTPDDYMQGVVLPAVKETWLPHTPAEQRVGLIRWQTLPYPSALWALVHQLTLNLDMPTVHIRRARFGHLESLTLLEGDAHDAIEKLRLLNAPRLHELRLAPRLHMEHLLELNVLKRFEALKTLHLNVGSHLESHPPTHTLNVESLRLDVPHSSMGALDAILEPYRHTLTDMTLCTDSDPLQKEACDTPPPVVDVRAMPLVNLSIQESSACLCTYTLHVPPTLKVLDLYNIKVSPDLLERVLQEAHTLHTLTIDCADLTDTHAKVLARSALPHLHTLDLRINRIGPDGAKAIAQSTTLSALTNLNLEDNIGPEHTLEHWRTHNSAPSDVFFGELRAAMQQPPDTGRWWEILNMLDERPDRQEVQHEFIHYVRDLARTWPDHIRHAPNDWLMRLQNNQLTEVLSLARSLHIEHWQVSSLPQDFGSFKALTTLSVDYEAIQPVFDLLALAAMNSVEHLTLSGLTDKGTIPSEHMPGPEAEGFPKIKHVTFTHCESCAASVRLLGVSSLGKSLQALELSECDTLTSNTMRTLTESSYFHHLHTLKLPNTRTSADALTQLLRSKPGALKHLDLNHNDLSDEDTQHIIATPWTSQLHTLELLGSEITDPETIRPILVDPKFHALQTFQCASHDLIHEDWLVLKDAVPSSPGAAAWMRVQGMLD